MERMHRSDKRIPDGTGTSEGHSAAADGARLAQVASAVEHKEDMSPSAQLAMPKIRLCDGWLD